MYKLLATDIDDTLLALDGSLPEANRDAIRRLQAAGVVVVFSSGRADISIRSVASEIVELADDEYIISFNGARVVSAKSGTPLVELPLSPEMVAQVMSYTRPRNLLVLGYTGTRFLVEEDGPRAKQYALDTGMDYDVVDDLVVELEMAGGSPKLLIIGEHEALAAHLPRLQDLGSADANDTAPDPAVAKETAAGAAELSPRSGWRATFSKPQYLEVVRSGVDKGVALRKLAEHLDIPIEETVAVGDSMNDAEMIRAAGLGLAVGNARSELKAIADSVTERSADEGAIAEVAERFFGV
jgi:hypothetical protein